MCGRTRHSICTASLDDTPVENGFVLPGPATRTTSETPDRHQLKTIRIWLRSALSRQSLTLSAASSLLRKLGIVVIPSLRSALATRHLRPRIEKEQSGPILPRKPSLIFHRRGDFDGQITPFLETHRSSSLAIRCSPTHCRLSSGQAGRGQERSDDLTVEPQAQCMSSFPLRVDAMSELRRHAAGSGFLSVGEQTGAGHVGQDDLLGRGIAPSAWTLGRR
jgi:hypothetical protein